MLQMTAFPRSPRQPLLVSHRDCSWRRPRGAVSSGSRSRSGTCIFSDQPAENIDSVLRDSHTALQPLLPASPSTDPVVELTNAGALLLSSARSRLFTSPTASDEAHLHDDEIRSLVVDDFDAAGAKARQWLIDVCKKALEYRGREREYVDAFWLLTGLDDAVGLDIARNLLESPSPKERSRGLALFALASDALEEVAPLANSVAREAFEGTDYHAIELSFAVLRSTPVDHATFTWLIAKAATSAEWSARARVIAKDSKIIGTPDNYELIDTALRDPRLHAIAPDLLENVTRPSPVATAFGISWLFDEDQRIRQLASAYFLRWGRDDDPRRRTLFVESASRSEIVALVWRDALQAAAGTASEDIEVSDTDAQRLRELWDRGWATAIRLEFADRDEWFRRPWDLRSHERRQKIIQDQLEGLIDNARWRADSDLRAALQRPTLADSERFLEERWSTRLSTALLLPRETMTRHLQVDGPLRQDLNHRFPTDQDAIPAHQATALRAALLSEDAEDRAAAAIWALQAEPDTIRLRSLFDAAVSADDRIRSDAVYRIFQTGTLLRPTIDDRCTDAFVGCLVDLSESTVDAAEPRRSALFSTFCCSMYFDGVAFVHQVVEGCLVAR